MTLSRISGGCEAGWRLHLGGLVGNFSPIAKRILTDYQCFQSALPVISAFSGIRVDFAVLGEHIALVAEIYLEPSVPFDSTTHRCVDFLFFEYPSSDRLQAVAKFLEEIGRKFGNSVNYSALRSELADSDLLVLVDEPERLVQASK